MKTEIILKRFWKFLHSSFDFELFSIKNPDKKSYAIFFQFWYFSYTINFKKLTYLVKIGRVRNVSEGVGRCQKMQKSYQRRFWKISYLIIFNFVFFFRFVDKFTEFLGSFVKSHLRRFESNAQFPILVFLNVLFKYTFEQQRTESYLACLDVWNVCVDYVQGLISSRVPEADVIVPKYRGLFILKIRLTLSGMTCESKKNAHL